ncbi:Uncharacterized conserved protein, DUF924 family [Roseivivax marinus]|uniref:DUF924 family protein n=1 Tax=Roseivivax marinus TaxID=1379903 RepID=UPI0008CCEE04|nr:DUF924 family protein [Roseivivax marinus]SEL07866.1 Uncharacterized conserved protein, DUF924 family [Roseivivax marinus]
MSDAMTTTTRPEDILGYWIDEVGPEGWYRQDDAVDETIRTRFRDAWDEGMEGAYALWLTYPSGVLAYAILMDQFPRNMFRDDPRAYASDRVASAAAKQAIGRNWDLRIDEPARQFFYLPLMHAENLCDQDRCVRLICERMPETGADNLVHAKAHREVIRRFGRFPHRNGVLGRTSTADETAFMEEGGYGRVVREIKEPA